MLRKSLFVALGFLGLLAAGTVAGTQPASAHYGCGPWNNWCAKHWYYPGYRYGWYGHSHKKWGNHYKYRNKHHSHHGHNGKNWRKYR
jgi:hypothetical protein